MITKGGVGREILHHQAERLKNIISMFFCQKEMIVITVDMSSL
jgi:hypothetical protein